MKLRGRSHRTKVLNPNDFRVLAPLVSKGAFTFGLPKTFEGCIGYESSAFSSTTAPSDSASTLGEKTADATTQELSFLRERVEKLEGVLQHMCAEFERFNELLPQDSPCRKKKYGLPKVDLRQDNLILDDIRPKAKSFDFGAVSNKLEDIASQIAGDLEPLVQSATEEMPEEPNPSAEHGIDYTKASSLKQNLLNSKLPNESLSTSSFRRGLRASTAFASVGAKTTSHAEQVRNEQKRKEGQSAKIARFRSTGELLNLGENSLPYKISM